MNQGDPRGLFAHAMTAPMHTVLLVLRRHLPAHALRTLTGPTQPGPPPWRIQGRLRGTYRAFLTITHAAGREAAVAWLTTPLPGTGPHGATPIDLIATGASTRVIHLAQQVAAAHPAPTVPTPRRSPDQTGSPSGPVKLS